MRSLLTDSCIKFVVFCGLSLIAFGGVAQYGANLALEEWQAQEQLLKLRFEKNKERSDRVGAINSALELGTFYNNRNSRFSDYEKAITVFTAGIEFCKAGDVRFKALFYEGIGDAGRFLQNVIIAVDNYQKAGALYEQLKDVEKTAICFHRTGDLYLDQGKYQLSKANYERAIERYRKVGNWSRVASCTSNIGETLVHQGKSALGLKQFKSALEINRAHENDSVLEAFTLFEIGRLYLDSSHLVHRDTILLKGLAIVENFDILDGIAYGNILLAKYYFIEKEYDEALVRAKLGLEYAESYGHKIKIRMAYEILSKIYESMGNYKNALAAEQKFLITDLEIREAERELFSAEMETKYQLEKKNAQIAIVEGEKNMIRSQKQSAQEQRDIIIGFSILLAIALIMLLIYHVKLRNSNRQLSFQKIEVERTNSKLKETVSYKDVLLKEVHHRVKNNLQVICSILELQTEASNNDTLKDKLQISLDRVFSMALVHEQLYSDDSNEYVELSSYLQDIISSIMSSHDKLVSQVGLEVDIDDIQLPLQTALPVGMIFNELITNSYKYAFNELDKTGMLKIKAFFQQNNLTICLSDNGPGVNLANSRSGSLGMQIANDFTLQLGGNLKQWNDNGAHYELEIPDLGRI